MFKDAFNAFLSRRWTAVNKTISFVYIYIYTPEVQPDPNFYPVYLRL